MLSGMFTIRRQAVLAMCAHFDTAAAAVTLHKKALLSTPACLALPLALEHVLSRCSPHAVPCAVLCRLRFSVAFWHSFKGDGSDPFGSGTKAWPWNADKDPLQAAFKAMHANFELMSKLGVDRWCFHDRSVQSLRTGAHTVPISASMWVGLLCRGWGSSSSKKG